MNNLKVFTIILNWNGKTDTLECIESVLKTTYVNNQLIVVDNGSTDDSITAIKALYPDLVLLENRENLGFAEGNNIGIRYALQNGADYVFLLNNDTILDSEAHQALIDASIELDDNGIFGAKTYYYDSPDMIWFDGGFWDPDKMKFYHDNYKQIDTGENTGLKKCDYICGCALFISAKIIDKIGFMDKNLFLTYEETDWCYRGKAQGFLSYVVSSAKVWHKISVSFGGSNSPMQEYFFMRNSLYWGERHLGRIVFLRLFAKCVFKTIGWEKHTAPSIAGTYWNIRRLFLVLFGEPAPVYQARKSGLRDYIRRRQGDCPSNVRSL
ncbi:MAG: glycosyltransferase family 2 protein [Alcanivoracaceae bacterium]|nr:glycosyltransferase family 2 protein [Alcanivoracaceae bacterium]